VSDPIQIRFSTPVDLGILTGITISGDGKHMRIGFVGHGSKKAQKSEQADGGCLYEISTQMEIDVSKESFVSGMRKNQSWWRSTSAMRDLSLSAFTLMLRIYIHNFLLSLMIP